MDTRPIGVLDSGFGGLSTLKQALKQLPKENYIYYGDNAHAPYGNRAPEEIRYLTEEAARHLCEAGAKAVLIACNTASAAALELVKAELPIPVVGIRPAIEPACAASSGGIVLMLATKATVRSPAYLSLRTSLEHPDIIHDIGCPADLVRGIEAGVRDDAVYIPILDRVLKSYHGALVDGIVLGCTHYPFIESAIKRYANEHFQGSCAIFEGGEKAVVDLKNILQVRGLENLFGNGEIQFCTSGERDRETRIYNRLISEIKGEFYNPGVLPEKTRYKQGVSDL